MPIVKRCAFLTMDSLVGFVCDDRLAHAPLRSRGWSVDEISWRARADWNQYDLVVIRSTWDYQNDPDAFLGVLEQIEGSTARLENPLDLVRWNLRKTYLRDLEEQGIAIVPTQWFSSFDIDGLAGLFELFQASELVVKPEVGANADYAFRLRPESLPAAAPELAGAFSRRPFLAQPFLPAVTAEGEFSLFYFRGEWSHCILKTPKPGDFRVQEEHGGWIRPLVPEPQLLQASHRALAALPGPSPLYARVDLVRDPAGVFRVMEFELIEPALYFRMDPDSADRFADAVDSTMVGTTGPPITRR